jgi:hypothetical protein
VSTCSIEPALAECEHWNVFDANAYLGHSGVHGELALETPALLSEMDRFAIKRALVSHFAGLEYDAVEGNRALERDMAPRFTPAWAVSAEHASMEDIISRSAKAVRVWFGPLHHNFSSRPWCSGSLFEYLQQSRTLVLISRPEIEWDDLSVLLGNFPQLRVLLLDVGYRSDRYLFPLLEQFPDLSFDSSIYVSHRQLEWYLSHVGPDRIVFGSRLPLYTPAAALAVLATARIANRARLAVAGDNLRRLLGESA